ncbi:MAG TPA: universal stress protein [Terriglobia bacterium]|nr:universal stress protein [Terriglobia bacterium]
MGKPKVIVAFRDAEHIESLVELACQMSKGMDGDVTALHVLEVGPGLPLDAAPGVLDRGGNAILARAREVAAGKFGQQIATRLVRGREAGTSIVREAVDQRAALVVLGYHEKTGLSNLLLGSTVEFVVRHAPCRVIVQVQPPSGRES